MEAKKNDACLKVKEIVQWDSNFRWCHGSMVIFSPNNHFSLEKKLATIAILVAVMMVYVAVSLRLLIPSRGNIRDAVG